MMTSKQLLFITSLTHAEPGKTHSVVEIHNRALIWLTAARQRRNYADMLAEAQAIEDALRVILQPGSVLTGVEPDDIPGVLAAASVVIVAIEPLGWFSDAADEIRAEAVNLLGAALRDRAGVVEAPPAVRPINLLMFRRGNRQTFDA